MKEYDVYNLVFPDYVKEMEIAGYRFRRVVEYEKRYKELDHKIGEILSKEIIVNPQSGIHSITAKVRVPEIEDIAVISWSDEARTMTALDDILLLLSFFTGRDVFTTYNEDWYVFTDPRCYMWEDNLRRYLDQNYASYDKLRLQYGVESVYSVIKTQEWREQYSNGIFLIWLREALRGSMAESKYIFCWIIWEHIFMLLEKREDFKEITNNLKMRMGKEKYAKKITPLLVYYEFMTIDDDFLKTYTEKISDARNELVHEGRLKKLDKENIDYLKLFALNTIDLVTKILDIHPKLGWAFEKKRL